MNRLFNKIASVLYSGVRKPVSPSAPMTEQQILDTIADDWINDVDPAQLEAIAKEMWIPVINGVAEQIGLPPSNNVALLINQLAAVHGVSEKIELKELKNACLQNAKIELFTELYGEWFETDENGALLYSQPMLRKITGLA